MNFTTLDAVYKEALSKVKFDWKPRRKTLTCSEQEEAIMLIHRLSYLDGEVESYAQNYCPSVSLQIKAVDFMKKIWK